MTTAAPPRRRRPRTTPRSSAASADDAPQLWRLVLAVVLGLLTGLTIEVLALLLLAVVKAVAGSLSNAGATVVLDVGSAVAWLVAGGVGYEVGRSRTATLAVASLPALVALALALGLVVGRRHGLATGLVAVVAFGFALGGCAYAGGVVWERHIRRAGAVQSGE